MTYPEKGELMQDFVQRVSTAANQKVKEEKMKIMIDGHDDNDNRKTKVSDSNKRYHMLN